ncbi:TPA: GNAT family N-acetyltransferase [Pseudomonas putida]|nr:GNAT family N-acetyltransferase [Pseudomonas putida]
MARPVSAPKTRPLVQKTPKPPVVKAKSKLGPVPFDKVEFTRTPGGRERGGGPGGEAWIISVDGKRAGVAYINLAVDAIRGQHASFHVFLNRPSQGRQIGRAAYQHCCQNSQYDVIYAHMRKSNLASRKAAEHAGFVEDTVPGDTQLVLAWRRDAVQPATFVSPEMIDSATCRERSTTRALQTAPSEATRASNEKSVSSLDLQFDEKSSDVIIWNGQVVMSRTEEAYFNVLFYKLAHLQPRTVLEIGFGLGISAGLIQQYLKPEKHDIYEIETSIYQDLVSFARQFPSVQPFCGDWDQCQINERYDFIFFDPFDYLPEESGEEGGEAETRRQAQRDARAEKMRALLNPEGVLCHPHFGDGDVPALSGFSTVVVARIKVSPIRMADETLCEDVAIVYHTPLA